MKKLLFTLLAMTSVSAFADPTVFNMELGKTTEKEVSDMYSLEKDGVNNYSNGNQYYINTKDLDFEDLKSACVIFDDKGVLVGVLLKVAETDHMSKGKFEYLYKILNSKYKLVNKKRPFVGDQFAKFKDGDSVILLEEPHMGNFEVRLNYLRNDFLKSYNKISKEEETQKTKSESSAL